jgi:O-antigen biosynthesis protein
MTFWEHFLRVLPAKPVPAFQALFWHVTRRRVRARNRLRTASADLAFPYRIWIDRIEKIDRRRSEFVAAIDEWRWRPRFTVILHGPTDYKTDQLDRSIKSVQRQIYPASVVKDGSIAAMANAVAGARGDYIVPLRIGDLLSEAALFRFAEALQDTGTAAILYGDQDEFDHRRRRCRPWFKPRWNEEMFLALDYVSAVAAIRTDLAQKVCQEAKNVGEIVLSVTSLQDGAIIHVPHILCHVRGYPETQEERVAWVREHLQAAKATCSQGPFGTLKIDWPLPEELPLVSIIIPTRDKVELLRPCLDSVLQRTDYENFEILIIDNDSEELATRSYFEEVTRDPRVRVFAFPGRYNFPAINNFAASQARGSYLCLLNNDTEVVGKTWLTEMMRYAVRADVGAVGAKLLYADGSIQHAGVVIGIGGVAGHAHRFLASDNPGYFRQPHVAQFASAVTAACLVVDKDKFLAVGGLDERELPVAFNDVDFCLKLQAAGWRNVYVPHAVLVHHESKTRDSDISTQNIDRFRREVTVIQDRWDTETYDDPFHNPNLDRATETFIVRL